MATPLLILYGSQTGNAQDVAEAIAREARLLLFAPRVAPMDAYPVAALPGERAAIFVASTTGQGDPPDNMRRFWRFLLRRALAADSLAGLHYAVFGLGDSVYVKYNATAKKLDRRLAALGARPLLERGLGDDSAPGGCDAALDPWLQRLWPVLRAALPLPPGVAAPVLDAAARLQLGPPKFDVELLGAPAADDDGSDDDDGQDDGASGGGGGSERRREREERRQREAVAAAAAFRAVAREASGLPAEPEASAANGDAAAAPHGPWRPFMAPLLVNRRLTSPGHFQDTRHLEFDLTGSGLTYEPGDALAIFPRVPEADVRAALRRLGLAPGQMLRITAAAGGGNGGSGSGSGSGGVNGDGSGNAGSGGAPAAAAATPAAAAAACVASARAVVQGILDVAGSPPRRYLFQVLARFASSARERERLEYFASSEGREELYDYNNRERRTLLEVLSDFPSATPPLARLLEAAPLLQPRLYSISSSPLAHPGRAHVTAAVVRYATPFKRQKRGLATTWLAGLAAPGEGGSGDGVGSGAAAAAVAMAAPRVPVWVERGCLRMPPLSAPLMLVGPGTGVAPLRSFLWQRWALLEQRNQRQQQQQQQNGAAAAADAAAADAGEEEPIAPCVLFFGCRAPGADFYYEDEWARLRADGVLDADWGLQVAFSRPALARAAADGGSGAAAETAAAAAGAAAGAAAAVAAGAAAAVAAAAAAAPAPAAPAKEYVTHRIRARGADVWRLLAARGGRAFVCGSAEKMPADVAAAVEAAAVEHGGLEREAAAKFVRQLEAAGRWCVEAWS